MGGGVGVGGFRTTHRLKPHAWRQGPGGDRQPCDMVFMPMLAKSYACH